MNARFFVPDAHTSGDVVAMPDDEAQHLTRVLRLGAGAAVRVFNGRGGEFAAVVASVTKAAATIRVGDAVLSAPEPRVAITLAQAVLKGDKMDDIVRDVVMMGAAAVQPMLTARSEVSWPTLERSRRRARWERIAVSSAKQCDRAVVPVIHAPIALADLPGAVADRTLPSPALMLVEPGASVDTVALGELDIVVPAEATVVIGPEGGWAPEEIEAASATCRFVSLGGRTLRADVMPVVAIAALFTRWQEF